MKSINLSNSELLQEVKKRLQTHQLKEEELNQILEAEQWKQAFILAEQDKERQKEIKEWDKIQAEDDE